MPATPWVDRVDHQQKNYAEDVNQVYRELKAGLPLAYYQNTQTLAGTKTLTDADFPLQYLDPGGAGRNVVLPAEANTNHSFVIVNTADAAETLTVKDDGGTTIGTIAQGENRQFVSNGLAWKVLSGGDGREILTANRTYYVRTDGNDSNTGLVNTAGGAFLTIQAAVNAVALLDISGYTVTIQIGDGTYTGAVVLKNVVGFASDGNLIITGNASTPDNVIVSTTSANAFYGAGLSVTWDIKNLKIITTTSGVGIYAYGSKIRFGNINFGACASVQIYANQNGSIVGLSNYAVSGNATCHILCDAKSLVAVNGLTITFSNSPVFSTYFLDCGYVSLTYVFGMTFTDGATVTATRYRVRMNGVVESGGATLPGGTAGSASTGGQYV